MLNKQTNKQRDKQQSIFVITEKKKKKINEKKGVHKADQFYSSDHTIQSFYSYRQFSECEWHEINHNNNSRWTLAEI